MTIKQFNCSKPGKCPLRLFILGFREKTNKPMQNPTCQTGTSKLTCPKWNSWFPFHMHVQSWSSLVSYSDLNLPIIWNSSLCHESHLSENCVCPITEICSETINIYHLTLVLGTIISSLVCFKCLPASNIFLPNCLFSSYQSDSNNMWTKSCVSSS